MLVQLRGGRWVSLGVAVVVAGCVVGVAGCRWVSLWVPLGVAVSVAVGVAGCRSGYRWVLRRLGFLSFPYISLQFPFISLVVAGCRG